jgi:RNA polymerase sigma-70 factor (ECF subfamily)
MPPDELQRRYHEHETAQPALGELWTRNRPSLGRRALRLVGGDPHLADDVLGQLALRLAGRRAQEQYDPNRPWLPWVYQILRRLSLDAFRRLLRGKHEQEPAGGLDFLPSKSPPPDEEAEREERKRLLREALAQLDPHDREILWLRFIEGLTLQEIADRLGISVATAHRRVKEALEHLRDRLSGDHQ